MYYYPRPQILKDLPQDQSAIIEASAGTGKTFTIEHLVIDLLLKGQVAIENILIVTFTEKAVGELRRRIRLLLQKILAAAQEPSAKNQKQQDCWLITDEARKLLQIALANFDLATIVTLHGFCQKVLHDFPLSTNQPLSTEVIDDSQLLPVALSNVLSDIATTPCDERELLESLLPCNDISKSIEKISKSLSTIFNYHTAIQDEEELTPAGQLLASLQERVRDELARMKHRGGLVSFDDILQNVDNALDPKVNQDFANKLLQVFPIAIIDEFQDTDTVQWSIFRRIYLEGGRQGRIFLVGDPKQAIYSFRGADVATYLQAKNDLLETGRGHVINLDTNFRTTKKLLDVFNTLFVSQNGYSFFTDNIPPAQELRAGNNSGEQLLQEKGTQLVPLVLRPVFTPPQAKLSKKYFQAQYLPWLAGYLRELITRPPYIKLKENEPARLLKASDIFILATKNNELQDIAGYLQQYGVPYNYYKEENLFGGDEAKDIADLLCTIANPFNDKLRLRAFLGPFFNVPLDKLDCYTNLPGNHPLITTLAYWQQLAESGHINQLFSSILQESHLQERLLQKNNTRSLLSYQRIADILTRVAAANNYHLTDIIDILFQYIQDPYCIGQEDNRHEQDFDQEAVQLLTMHKAKGLEAAVVAIAGGFSFKQDDQEYAVQLYYDHEDKRRLYIGKIKKNSHFEQAINYTRRSEIQRLMYVALTRAACQLILPTWTCPIHYSMSWAPMTLVNKCINHLLDNNLLQAKDNGQEIIHRATEEYSPDPVGQQAANNQVPAMAMPLYSPAADLASLQQAAGQQLAGPCISSYSRIKHLSGRGYSLENEYAEIDRLPEEVGSMLPGGTVFGNLVHNIFEHLDFSTADGRTFTEWVLLDRVQELFSAECRLYDYDYEHKPELAQLIYRAITIPIKTPGCQLPPLCTITQHKPEVEFYYPVPNNELQDLADKTPQIIVEHGYIKGYLDLFFTHNGHYYVLDWKTDRLPSYQEDNVRKHVKNNYEIQERLYSLALAKMLFLHSQEEYEQKFGGIIYLFVRAKANEEGLYFRKPDWSELRRHFQELSNTKLR